MSEGKPPPFSFFHSFIFSLSYSMTDLIIIGAGPGGYKAALYAARRRHLSQRGMHTHQDLRPLPVVRRGSGEAATSRGTTARRGGDIACQRRHHARPRKGSLLRRPHGQWRDGQAHHHCHRQFSEDVAHRGCRRPARACSTDTAARSQS